VHEAFLSALELSGFLLDAELDLVARVFELGRHVIERGAEASDLVGTGELQAVMEVPLGKLVGAMDEALDGTADHMYYQSAK
jgi:hypothetical protein